MLILLLSLWMTDVNILVQDIYEPLDKTLVVVAHTGDIFALNVNEARVQPYAADGTAKPAFSRRGQGPDELNQPNEIFVQDDNLFVTDYTKGILIFDLDGKFKKTLRLPQAFLSPTRVFNGWIYNLPPAGEETEAKLVWVDENLQRQRTMMSSPVAKQPIFFKLERGGGITVDFNPAMDQALYSVGNGGKTLFYYQPGSERLTILDLTKDIAKTMVPIPGEKLAYIGEWGEAKAAEIRENVELNGVKVTPTINIAMPDYFPHVNDMVSGPEGNVWIMPALSFINEAADPLVFDATGKQIKPRFSLEAARRVLALDKDRAVFLCFNREKEQPEIRSCAPAALESQLKALPNTPEVVEPRKFVINTR